MATVLPATKQDELPGVKRQAVREVGRPEFRQVSSSQAGVRE